MQQAPILMAQGRLLRLNSSNKNQLLNISDGVDPLISNQEYAHSSGKICEQVYGVFPCANSISGYIFLIGVYQYLLITGERLVSRGSKALFNILGPGTFGATIFPILKTLPRIVMVIASGVSARKEKAQNQISSGISTTVGATVFNLTLMWGICLINGTKDMTKEPGLQPAESSPFKRLKGLSDTGVTIDKETSYTAGIMLISLIPFVLVQPVTAFNSFFGRRILIFITLIVSLMLLLSYFLYQILNPWMQKRSLEYSKYENLLAGFLHHVQRHARGKLINEEGQPDIDAIKRFFHETDRDANKCLTLAELEKLILEMESGKVQVDKDFAISKILNSFDQNNDKIIEEEEFVEGCKRWIEEAKQIAQSDESNFKIRKVVEKYTKKQKDEIVEIEHIMARILKHVQTQALEAEHLVKDDGSPNVERIKEIFHQYDFDRNNVMTKPELEELIGSVKFGEVEINRDDSVKKVLRDFDRDGNDRIDEHEFVHGMTKWLNEAISATKCPDKKRAIDEYDTIKWSEVDKIVYEVEKDGEINYKLLTRAFNKSMLQVLLGIAILTLCAKPLVISIKDLSDDMGMPSFLIPFVMVPLALNARMAIAAIFPASQKSLKTASLTFSEIYGGVIMNNIMGMATLLAVVCMRDLRWDYSAEVLIILVVCSIIGLLAFFRTTYPLWTCLLAFSLYPFSVVLFYLLECVFDWA
ncbi:sodium/calcium exchanger NCL1-like isoform X2 [Lycium barbarum]|uniref:sodium/calcium exchanger NCL1-like isoform X2 n=1 Tax=Lycium barbarum TaxID=112863 RepID=UPI00293E022B|nr:sodium/calcium exchanger NCL1-like isoform X2 [Lycium barbarum]